VTADIGQADQEERNEREHVTTGDSSALPPDDHENRCRSVDVTVLLKERADEKKQRDRVAFA
jgi:hypothetical protein